VPDESELHSLNMASKDDKNLLELGVKVYSIFLHHQLMQQVTRVGAVLVSLALPYSDSSVDVKFERGVRTLPSNSRFRHPLKYGTLTISDVFLIGTLAIDP
jgi:hypothetical protein